MKKVTMVLVGDLMFDGRVKKEIRTLANNNIHVDLIMLGSKSDPEMEKVSNIHVVKRTRSNSSLVNLIQIIHFNIQSYFKIRKIKPDYVHCHDLNTLLSGFIGKRKFKFIYDSHELFPEAQSGIKRLFWAWLEKRLIKHVDKLIIPEINRAEYMKKKYKLKQPITILENWPSKKDINKEYNKLYFVEKYKIEPRQKKVLYTGRLMPDRGLDQLVESMKLLNNVSLFIVGDGEEHYVNNLRNKIKKLGLADVVFLHGAVPNSKILELISASDIGIAFYDNSNINNFYCASNKLFEHVESGKYVITNNYPGLISISKEVEKVICIEEITPKSIANAIKECISINLEQPPSKYLWERQEEKLLYIYQ